MMFHEFCHALELIEKSGKNGAKQRNLDVLWEKVCAAVCQAVIGASLTRRAERSLPSVLPSPLEILAPRFRQRAPIVSAARHHVRHARHLLRAQLQHEAADDGQAVSRRAAGAAEMRKPLSL
jgi:hypothetical protein